VAWQFAQAVPEAMCPVGLPVAVVPLWQEAQLPLTCAWSTRVTGRQLDVEWHASHVVVDWMCVALLPVALAPS